MVFQRCFKISLKFQCVCVCVCVCLCAGMFDQGSLTKKNTDTKKTRTVPLKKNTDRVSRLQGWRHDRRAQCPWWSVVEAEGRQIGRPRRETSKLRIALQRVARARDHRLCVPVCLSVCLPVCDGLLGSVSASLRLSEAVSISLDVRLSVYPWLAASSAYHFVCRPVCLCRFVWPCLIICSCPCMSVRAFVCRRLRGIHI